MSKVQILGPKGLLDEAVRALHAVAVVHIETVEAPTDLEDVFFKRHPLEIDKLEEKDELSRALERLKNLRFLLSRPEKVVPVEVPESVLVTLINEADLVEDRAKRIHGKLDGYAEESLSIARYEKILQAFATLVPKLGGLKSFEVLGLTIEKARKDVVRLLEEEVMRITGGGYELYVKDLDDDTTGLVLAYPKKFDAKVRTLITGESISEMRLPGEYSDMALLDVLKQMTVRKTELPGLKKDANRELKYLSKDWYARVEGLIKATEDALEEIGILSYCAQTRFAFIVEGWVPRESLDSLTSGFRTLFTDKVVVRELQIKEEDADLIPVYIENPRLIRPFELFLKALPTPRYGSVDPTPYVALFFPTFFGLIVGDIAYGAVLLVIGLVLRRRFKGKGMFEDVGFIVVVAALSSILFGFMFGEFLGDLGERLHLLHPIIFDRAHALKTFLTLTLGIGVGHVLLGLVIGMVNFLARGKKKKAAAKFVFIMLILSFLFSVAVVLEYLPSGLMTPGVVALVIFLVLAILLEGIIGPLEFISALGNIVSYMRIMAVGMASVVMAMVANQIGGLTGSLVLGILVAGILHTLNIMLVMLSPTIQSMRLQYVEFLSKFYEGGGRVYRPFKKR